MKCEEHRSFVLKSNGQHALLTSPNYLSFIRVSEVVSGVFIYTPLISHAYKPHNQHQFLKTLFTKYHI